MFAKAIMHMIYAKDSITLLWFAFDRLDLVERLNKISIVIKSRLQRETPIKICSLAACVDREHEIGTKCPSQRSMCVAHKIYSSDTRGNLKCIAVTHLFACGKMHSERVLRNATQCQIARPAAEQEFSISARAGQATIRDKIQIASSAGKKPHRLIFLHSAHSFSRDLRKTFRTHISDLLQLCGLHFLEAAKEHQTTFRLDLCTFNESEMHQHAAVKK